jgi:hypothetical protein
MHGQQVNRQIRPESVAHIGEEEIQAVQREVVATIGVSVHAGTFDIEVA